MTDLLYAALLFGGSLAAIFALFGLIKWLKLGGDPVLSAGASLDQAANEVEDGFEVMRHSIARGGKAALVRNQDGHILVLKRHGNKFAGRILTSKASAREEVDALIVDAGESQFGKVRLSLNDASYWADAINRL